MLHRKLADFLSSPSVRKTFGSILGANNGLGPGFDILRLGLAVAILVAHAARLAGTRGPIPSLFELILDFLGQAHAQTPNINAAAQETISSGTPWLRPIVITHVPMFFALSGFLVTGSAFRARKVLPFLTLRFFRIFPALCVEVALSAIVIGAVFTTLDLRAYYTDPMFLTYFGNIVGKVQMELPGVSFWRYDAHAVNANLWTLPSEFYCYLILAAMIVTGLIFNRALSTLLFGIASILLIVANVFFGFDSQPWILAPSVNVYYFFMGAMFFHWRDLIPHKGWLCLACIPIAYVLEFSTQAVYLVPVFVTYITIYVGLCNIPTNKLLRSGDYSYGIYLYGYPIMQAIVASVPFVRYRYFTFTSLALATTLVFSILSWHLIEKHFLKLRHRISKRSASIETTAAAMQPRP
ncbi:acyltransferase [Bradyrhizobium sp. LTSP857]|uniref:acyltransferase family protein n=1 Tax=Bradyrhizobium sp. LTSP857 TaxID=1619231 RepID=UPI0006793095|nr:acyltransferase [Bradyrhizobium sp. LTSP857]